MHRTTDRIDVAQRPGDVAGAAGAARSLVAALVVPCYNEATRLDLDAFSAFLAGVADVRVVFVDDGSTDRTLDRLRAYVAGCAGRADVLALGTNGGKAEAVRRGMLHALTLEPQFVGFWDADLATPLCVLPEFIALLRGDAARAWVIGSRVRLLGRQIERRAARHYAGRVFATGASVVLGLPVYDTQCGAKLFRADAVLRECLAEPFISRWIFDVELIARFRAAIGAGAQVEELIYEYPLPAWRDVAGSKVELGAFLKAAVELVRIRRRYGRPRPPSAPPSPR